MRISQKQLLWQQQSSKMMPAAMCELKQIALEQLPEGKFGAAWTQSIDGKRPTGQHFLR